MLDVTFHPARYENAAVETSNPKSYGLAAWIPGRVQDWFHWDVGNGMSVLAHILRPF